MSDVDFNTDDTSDRIVSVPAFYPTLYIGALI